MTSRFAYASCGLLLALMAPVATAQTGVPSTEQMIEKLAAPPRTRSLRNLIVEPGTPGAQNTEERPSLSLLIQFDFDSARVKTESRQALSNLSEAMKSDKLAGARFAIEGHTDARGRADYNLRLSQQRAEAVRALLRDAGVEEARLVASGKGSTEPANKDEPNAAENRRVRIVNLQ